jgi:hypothetical protein
MKLILVKIDFCRAVEDVSYDYEHLSDNDKEKVSNIDIVASFDFEDEYQIYNRYFLISPNEIEKYRKILDDNIIPYLCTDFSSNVIQNKMNLERILLKYTNNNNEIEYYKFINRLNEWIKENLDIDIVLDMINEKGINSLRTVDKEFLKTI